MFRKVLSKMCVLLFVISVLVFQSHAQAKLQFKQWVDPTESAFSLDVPVGWKISGGIKRASDTRSTQPPARTICRPRWWRSQSGKRSSGSGEDKACDYPIFISWAPR